MFNSEVMCQELIGIMLLKIVLNFNLNATRQKSPIRQTWNGAKNRKDTILNLELPKSNDGHILLKYVANLLTVCPCLLSITLLRYGLRS